MDDELDLDQSTPPQHSGFGDTESTAEMLAERMKKRLEKESADEKGGKD